MRRRPSPLLRAALIISAVTLLAYAASDLAGIIDVVRNLVLLSLILTLVIGIHEFCHLLTARALGVKVKEFGLAFGPEIVGRDAFGIRWRINALPVGGYVKLHGEGEDDGPGSFASAAAWRKIVILLVGPISNLILAVLILMGLAAVLSFSKGTNWTIGQDVEFARQILLVIVQKTAEAVGAFLPHAASRPLDMPLMGLPGMVSGTGAMLNMGADLAPIMIVVFIASISFSVGVMNLLPIPPLDGGQAFVALLHGVFGRYYPARLMTAFTALGFGILILFVVAINGLDVIRLLLSSIGS